MEEAEAISLIYGLLQGLKAYREAYNQLNKKEGKSSEIKLEEVISMYKRFEQIKLEKVISQYKQFEGLLSFLGKVVG